LSIINNCSSARYYVCQLRSAILLVHETMNEWIPTFFSNIFTQELFNRIYPVCWKIHNKYVFHVNIHIFVLKYLVQIQIIQNQFKISEGGKWNSHQMSCVYSSRMAKNYRICPIRIEIIHGRHRVVQIYTWAGPLYS
jgi:hypothetical protein